VTHRPLLLGFTVPDEVANELFAHDPVPAVQTHRFAWSLARSLRSAFGDVKLLSARPVQSYPLVPHMTFRRQVFTQDEIQGVSLGFINLLVLKHLTRFLSCLMQTPMLLRRWRINAVFIHGVHTPWLVYGSLLQRLGMVVVPVLTDPAGVILPSDGLLSRTLKRLDRKIVDHFVSRATAVVALAPDLVAAYPTMRHSLVFPGIIGQAWLDQLDRVPPNDETEKPFTVVYAGGVSAAYGVDRLLDAARLLPDIDFVIVGKGDQVDRIVADAAPNVISVGFVPPDQLARHLLAGDLLINPRPSDADFARNSFPSKLLEYVATGRPVLTTQISSIPAAISGCFHYIEDETPEGIARAISSVQMRPVAELMVLAHQSREIVTEEYSEAAIGRKLACLLEKADSKVAKTLVESKFDINALRRYFHF